MTMRHVKGVTGREALTENHLRTAVHHSYTNCLSAADNVLEKPVEKVERLEDERSGIHFLRIWFK